MRIGFDPIFQVWRTYFHSQIVSIDGVFFWDSKKQLHKDLARKGLAVQGNKIVVIRETFSQ